MKAHVIISLVIFLSTCAITRSQHAQMQLRSEIGASVSRKKGVESTNRQLRLDTEIIKQNYCDGPDPDLLTLRLLIRLSFVNIGKQRIILERGSRHVPLVRISRTPEDAIADRYERSFENYIITANNNASKLPKTLTLSRFVVLQPGESYKSIADIDVPVPRANSVSASVDPGNHYLQIAVWTWDESQRQAKLRRRNWQREGFLWSETIVSEPMPFTVAAQSRAEDCHCRNFNVTEEQAVSLAISHLSGVNGSSNSYHAVSFDQGCEWHVVFEPKVKKANAPSLTYVIDKKTGKILDELR